MQPTMKLRWVMKRRTVTKEMVEELRDRTGLGMMECKRRLTGDSQFALQQWWEPDRGDSDLDVGEWRELETIFEELPAIDIEKASKFSFKG